MRPDRTSMVSVEDLYSRIRKEVIDFAHNDRIHLSKRLLPKLVRKVIAAGSFRSRRETALCGKMLAIGDATTPVALVDLVRSPRRLPGKKIVRKRWHLQKRRSFAMQDCILSGCKTAHRYVEFE